MKSSSEPAAPAQPGDHFVPTRRLLLAWAVMAGGLVGWWCSRPWLDATVFKAGQVIVIMLTWKIAALLCLPGSAWPRFTRLRLLAFCFWPGVQPQHFLKGYRPAPGAPKPTVIGLLVNIATGAALVWLVPYLLPDATPGMVRFWIALVGFCFLNLLARFDFYALVFRAMGFPVEKMWACPVASKTLGEFWGQRWNRVVSGMARDVVFLPLSRRAGPRVALFAVFLYSGVYHEIASFIADAGYGGPTLYFLVQWLGVSAESVRPVRSFFRSYPWLGRAWTGAVIVLPLGLLLHPVLINDYLMPMLTEFGVPGLETAP